MLTALNPSRSQTPITTRSPRDTTAREVALQPAPVRQPGQRVGERLALVPGRLAAHLLVVDPGGDAVDVDVPEAVAALGGEPEGAAGRRGARPAWSPARASAMLRSRAGFGGAERLGGDLDGVQPGDRLDRPAGGDGQADLAELAHVPGPGAVRRRARAAGPGRVPAPCLDAVAEGGPAGAGVAVGGQAAGAQPVGATGRARTGRGRRPRPAAPAGSRRCRRCGPAPPRCAAGCPARRTSPPGCPARGAELAGPFDRAERVAVEAQVGVGHRQVVPAPGGVPVRVVDGAQRAGGLDQMRDAAVQRALVVRGQRGQRVEVPVQVGLGEVADGGGGLLDGPGVLGRPAEVDQRGEALHERVGAGVRVPGGAEHPVEQDAYASAERLASCNARALRQGVNLVLDPVEPAHPRPPCRCARRRTCSCTCTATPHDYCVTTEPQHPSEGTGRRRATRRWWPAPPVTWPTPACPRRRAEAELLAAYVLGVPRGRLALADGFTDGQRDRSRTRWCVRRVGTGAVAAPDRQRRLPASGAGGRARACSCRARRPSCWPAGAVERGPRRRGRRAVGGGPVQRLRRDRAVGGPGGAGRPGDGGGTVPGRAGPGCAATPPGGPPRGTGRSRWSRRTRPIRTCWPNWPAGSTCCCATRRTCRGRWPYRPRWPGTTRRRRCSAGADGLAVIRPVIHRAAAAAAPGRRARHRARRHARRGGARPAAPRTAGTRASADHQDLAGRPRFATASRRPDRTGARSGRRRGRLAPRDALRLPVARRPGPRHRRGHRGGPQRRAGGPADRHGLRDRRGRLHPVRGEGPARTPRAGTGSRRRC